MPAAPSQASVAVVLCTYNGANYIQAQLESILAQSWPVAVRVFDDASSDNTVALINEYEHKLDLRIHSNSTNIGYVANFEFGIAQVLDEGFNYLALCDQDDIWHQERIAAGMHAIQNLETRVGTKRAILSHSDLRMINSTGRCVHSSFFKYRHYEINTERSLACVLGQNGVMGNTILMNRALAVMAQPFPNDLHVHDYWFAVLAELYGYRVLLEQTLVDYRIHDNNASNSSDSIKFGLRRLLDGKSWQGLVRRDFRLPFKEDYRLNVIDTVIDGHVNKPKLDKSQVQLLATFRQYLVFKNSRFKILHSMLRAGFFRKGLRHRIRLMFSTLLTKRYD